MTLSIEPRVENRAKPRAAANRERNAACGLACEPADFDWTFGRDGALTARDGDGRWISGCSLPRRAAIAQLRSLEVSGSVACYLAPAHASAIRVALDRLKPEQAIIAIVPGEADFHFMLHCEDFSQDVTSHRLHFMVGDNWSQAMKDQLERIPGLAIPTQFIRMSGAASELIDSMIAEAQRAFSQVATDRAEQIRALRAKPIVRSGRLCVVGASQKRLWNDWGAKLAAAVCDENCVRVDPDDPSQSSPLAIARAASECGAIITVDVSRADVPGVVSEELPWVTWVTGRKIPARASCGKRDRLLILDENDITVARGSGWSETEVRIAKPPLDCAEDSQAEIAPFIAIVTESPTIDPPSNLDDFSSHRLLWEFIADELTKNPFAIENGDVDAYLTSRMHKINVDENTLKRTKFVSSLIVPAYQQGIVQTLNDAKIPLRVTTEAREYESATALLHVWPDQNRVHRIDFASRPCIRPGRTSQEMVRRCREEVSNPPQIATPSEHIICAAMIRELIGSN